MLQPETLASESSSVPYTFCMPLAQCKSTFDFMQHCLWKAEKQPPQICHALIPGAYKCVMSRGKRELKFADGINVVNQLTLK